MKSVPRAAIALIALLAFMRPAQAILADTSPVATTTTPATIALADSSSTSSSLAITDSACDFSGQLAALAAIQQNPDLGYSQELYDELGIRRELLTAAITCDQDGITAREVELNQLPDSVKALPAYQQITYALADASRYYDNQKDNIPNLGLQGTKDVSRAIASWREGNYLPLIAWTDDLVLWAGNQPLLARVTARLDQLSRLAFSLKLVDQDQVTTSFQKAQSDFQNASEQNNAAENALNQSQPDVALADMKASLQSLSDTYAVFFDLQDALQKIVN